MSVLHEIVEWSKERPEWQRDSLRRLMLQDVLTENDICELAELCKQSRGLSEGHVSVPLEKLHVPNRDSGSARTNLVSIFHHRGVNALAEGQTLNFAPNLTLIYGDNAAGKTGYIRILKSACRARGQEEILGNVASGSAPPNLDIAIKYKVGAESSFREWAGEGSDDFISRVSIFDSQCAAVYLTEKTDVAFRPFGLDLFDKLVKACKAVRTILENEQRALAPSTLTSLMSSVSPGTSVSKLLEGLSSLTKPEAVETLSHLSLEDEKRLLLVEKSLLDMQANDPQKLIRQLTLRSSRIRALARHLKSVEISLSDETVNSIFRARSIGRQKSEEAKRLREFTFQEGMLTGTGTEIWTNLWEAARHYSEQLAYASLEFPVTEDGAKCVLCQQELSSEAAQRLMQFHKFVVSTTERELREARETFAKLRKGVLDLSISTESSNEALQEIRLEQDDLPEVILNALTVNENRRKAVADALSSDSDLAADCPDLISTSIKVEALADQLDDRIKTLRDKSATDETKNRLTAEAQELRSRKLLRENKALVLEEIERKKKFAAYSLCLEDTKTHAITQKSTSLTRSAVTQKLTQSFQDELSHLNFRHVEVELKEVGGTEGVLYHKLILTRAPGVELPRVASEGEQRCLSIAAFFAELSTADDPSAIVFDDPVSSLDYKWREGVARRLVEEAKNRQVIVFTHDIVFLLLLNQLADEQQVEKMDQHVRQLSKGAGVCAEELPWVALPVKKKIGFLKNELQAAAKLFREGHQSSYEKEAKFLYGLLREAWERAVEEVLLGGVVERFRPSVETRRVAAIADITPEDCSIVEAAMTKCSKWLPGHDQAAAARAEIPEPPELASDIEALESFVTAIKSRRN